jgi:hypothetical protein
VFPFYFADRFSGAVVHLTANDCYKMTITLKPARRTITSVQPYQSCKQKCPHQETDAGISAINFVTGVKTVTNYLRKPSFSIKER